MSKTVTIKVEKPIVQPAGKAAASKKAVPVKTAAVKKAAPIKKAEPVRIVVKFNAPVKKAAPVKKVEPVKAAEPVKKHEPVKKQAAPVKKVEAVKKAEPVKKQAAPVKRVEAVKKAEPVKKPAAPVKKVEAVKKAEPVKKQAAPVKKVEAVKKAEPVKKPAAPVKKAEPVKAAAPVKTLESAKKILSKKAAAKKSDHAEFAHDHVRILTSAEAAVRMAAAKAHNIRKNKLSKSKKKHYKDLLTNLRLSFQQQLNIHRADALTNKKDTSGPSAGMATHMADLGSDNFQHDFELGLLSDEGSVLEMIEEALIRLEDNEYGICLECGKDISPARLEVKPYARYCVACKSHKEEFEAPERRHR